MKRLLTVALAAIIPIAAFASRTDDVRISAVSIRSTVLGGRIEVYDAKTGSLVKCPIGFDCRPKRSFLGRLIRLFR